MTSALLMAKVLLGTVGVGGIAVANGFALVSMSSTPPVPSTIKAVIVKGTPDSSAGLSTASLSIDNSVANYKCKLSTSDKSPVPCELIKLNTDKKWSDLTTIKAAADKAPISSADLKVATNYFKLIIDTDLYSTVNLTTTTTIDIVDATSPNTKYATVTPLFKIADDQPEYQKATHILGKGPSAASSTIKDTGSTCICSVDETPSGTGSPCIAIAFGSKTASTTANVKYSDQTFAYSNTALESLTANQYYLLKWTTPDSNFDTKGLDDKTQAHITKSTYTSWSTKASLTDIVHVIVDGTTADAVAFIMSTHTAQTSN